MKLLDTPLNNSVDTQSSVTTFVSNPFKEAFHTINPLKSSAASIHARVVDRQAYSQTNLVTDDQANLVQSGFAPAQFTDPNLVNPWSISYNPTGAFWVSDNGTGVSTLYNGAGQPFPVPPNSPLVVTIPAPNNSPAETTATPTGQVFNGTSDFVVSNGDKAAPSLFIFATEDGTISGWNPQVDPTHAFLLKDNSAVGAVYKGLASDNTPSGNFLYGANFHSGTIDIFDKDFNAVGSFADPNAPTGFAPFNIQNLGGKLYVTFAKQDESGKNDVAGSGNGFIDVFDPESHTFTRFASGTAAGGQIRSLNSPWGLAIAPSDFGKFSNDLLVGNFGNGLIDAFDPQTGAFLGKLKDAAGKPVQIDGLWGLAFGNGGQAGKTNELFFTAGINDEQHGLFGKLEAQTLPELKVKINLK